MKFDFFIISKFYAKMAYRQGYRRTRRYRRKFTKARLFTHTSRHAQARQIYAVSKRLSNYIRRTRPETKISQFLSQTLIPNTGTQDANGGFIQRIFWTYPGGITSDNIKPPEGTYDGEFCRLYNLSIDGVLRYQDNESSRSPLWIRLVVIQNIKSRNSLLEPNDVFRRSNTGTDADNPVGNALAVHGPLQSGVSSLGRILYDRRYSLQPGRTSSRRISFNLKRLVNYRVDKHGTADQGSSTESIGQGCLWIFIATSYSATDEEGPASQLILNAKLAYPDN